MLRIKLTLAMIGAIAFGLAYGAPLCLAADPAVGFAVEEMLLVEVLSFKNGDAAVLVLPNGDRILVREGDALGNAGGKVVRIGKDVVVVEERRFDPSTDLVVIEEKKLGQSAAGKSEPVLIEVPADTAGFKGEPIGVDFMNLELLDALRKLAAVMGFNFVATGDVRGRVTMRAENVPGDLALHLLLDRTGHAGLKGTQVLMVAPKRRLDPKAPPPQLKENYTGDPISFDFKDMEITDALDIIAEMSGRTFLVHPSVKQKISIRVKSVPWDELMDHVLYLTGLAKARQGRVILIAPKQILAGEWKPLVEGKYSGERISVDFHEADMASALERVTAPSGKKLAIDGGEGAKLSLRLHNAPWDLVLDIIVTTHGLAKAETDDAIEITVPAPE